MSMRLPLKEILLRFEKKNITQAMFNEHIVNHLIELEKEVLSVKGVLHHKQKHF